MLRERTCRLKAAVLREFKSPLQIVEFPQPDLGDGEVLVRITAAGVCGSDVHMWLGEDPRTPLPMILGHEGVGVIEEIGGKGPRFDLYGRELKPGDPVIWDRAVVCGMCYFCAVKRLPNLCRSRWVYGIHRSCSDPPHLNGCYADHILLVSNTKIISIVDWPDLDPAALVSAGCSGATAANAIELSGIEIGDSVLIQGAGPLGLYLVGYARTRGAEHVIVIEGVQSRMELARRLGADLVLDFTSTTPEERKEAVMSLTHGRGADVGFEAVGRPEPVVEGIDLLRRGGTYVIVGTAVPMGTIPIDFYYQIVLKQLRLQGAWTNDTRHIVQALSIVRRNAKVFSDMVTHRFGLDQANEALRSMAEREAIKAAIVSSTHA
ncbi:MAG: zinc-binding dehydrogenase [Armatimonadetes bacterium]|nr:zinc-binding dehydrogenase [Armatimonadota bacterium]